MGELLLDIFEGNIDAIDRRRSRGRPRRMWLNDVKEWLEVARRDHWKEMYFKQQLALIHVW